MNISNRMVVTLIVLGVSFIIILNHEYETWRNTKNKSGRITMSFESSEDSMKSKCRCVAWNYIQMNVCPAKNYIGCTELFSKKATQGYLFTASWKIRDMRFRFYFHFDERGNLEEVKKSFEGYI